MTTHKPKADTCPPDGEATDEELLAEYRASLPERIAAVERKFQEYLEREGVVHRPDVTENDAARRSAYWNGPIPPAPM